MKMSPEAITNLISLGVQLIMLLVIAPINKRISRLEEKLESLREKHDCDSLMCRHDGEIKGIKNTMMDHEKRLSRLEGGHLP